MASSEEFPGVGQERSSLYERMKRSSLIRRAVDTPVCQKVLAPARGDGSVNRFIRYSMVSAVAIVISQATILICAWVFGLSGIAANTIGALVSTPASYELNRKWAWRKGGKSHLWREVVPFWSLTIIGWLASTGTVEIADSLCKSHGVTGLARAVAIMGASLFAYGVVWIGKFFVFNRLVFATPGVTAEDEAQAGGEDGAPAAVTVPPAPVLDGPVLDGPVLDGPVLDGPVLDGTVLDGTVLDGTVLDASGGR
jgi:putative flippase GtrA